MFSVVSNEYKIVGQRYSGDEKDMLDKGQNMGKAVIQRNLCVTTNNL